jgi:hypothetical protein
MVAQAAAGAGEAALRYFIADKYVKAFEGLTSNPSSKLVVVPVEASALAGGITGAMELLRGGGFGGGPADGAPRSPAVPPPPSPRPPSPPAAPPPSAPPPATGSLPGLGPWNQG